jgi:hypothetical protein
MSLPRLRFLLLVLICVAATARSAAAADRIALKVERHATGAPVTLGVPFPRGVLASPDHVRVLASDGREVPSQVTEVTTWQPVDPSVKWVWVFFFAADGADYQLEYGADVRRARVPAGLDGQLLVLNSQRPGGQADIVAGPLQLTVRQGRTGFVHEASLDLEGDGFEADDVIAVGPEARGSFVDLLDEAGVDASRATITQTFLERGSGPLHAILRIEGTYRYGRSDNHAAPFVTRLHAYAGQTWIRVQHTMVYTGVPDRHRPTAGEYPHVATQAEALTKGDPSDPGWTQPEDRIQAMGMSLALKLKPGAVARTALLDGPWWQRDAAPRIVRQTGALAVTQLGPQAVNGVVAESSPTARQETFAAHVRAGGQVRDRAARAIGWVDVSDDTRGVAIGVRHFLEEYPKSIAFDAATSQLDAFFWAAEGGPASFAREHTRPGAEGSVENWAQGLAKTSEAIVYFHPSRTTDAEIGRVMGYVLQPAVAHVDPAWYARSGVYGEFAPAGRGPAELDRALDHKVRWMLFNQRWAPWFGVFDYGDVKVRYDNGAWDMWGHNEPAQDFELWVHFMRTGDPAVFDAALALSRHTMDVDNTHWPTGPAYRGDSNQSGDFFLTQTPDAIAAAGGAATRWLGIGRRHSTQHWMHALSAHVWVQGWLAAYYLAGETRALDVARVTADMHRGRMWGEHELTGRRLYLSVWNLAEVWDATKDPVYADELKDRVARMLRLAQADGDGLALERYGYAQVYATHGLARYYSITGNETVREALVRHARHERDVPALNHWMESYLASIHALSIGYQLSKEPSLKEELARRVALLRTDPLPAPVTAEAWTQASLAEALTRTDHIPDAPSWYRREFSATARARTPNWHPLHGLRFFGWTTGHGLPWALAALGY